MTILAIETSCDETAVCLADYEGRSEHPQFSVLGNALISQIELHTEYGGVFPSLAKREHARNLIPLLKKVLTESGFLKKADSPPSSSLKTINYKLKTTLEREPELLETFLEFVPTIEKPPIDAIAVTYGPGLPPALWVGINFAKALSLSWNIPVVPINHMEGHLLAALLEKHSDTSLPATTYNLQAVAFPAIALLISGAHTELVLMRDWLSYEVIGETRDDAAGEAFDKVARMMGLPYPGGPEIARLAESSRSSLSSFSSPALTKNSKLKTKNQAVLFPRERGSTSLTVAAGEIVFPRPMLHSPDFDFSFSGLKTAVLYFLKKQPGNEDIPFHQGPRTYTIDEHLQEEVAREFEDATVDVLLAKTKKALEAHGAQTLIMGGGVSASKEIRRRMRNMVESDFPGVALLVPELDLTGDNAVMIAIAAALRLTRGASYEVNPDIAAEGNLRLS